MNSPSSALYDVPAGADVAVEGVRLVLNQDGDFPQSGVQAVAECKVDDAIFPSERDGGLGPMFGERMQTFAASPGQHHRKDILHGGDCSRNPEEIERKRIR